MHELRWPDERAWYYVSSVPTQRIDGLGAVTMPPRERGEWDEVRELLAGYEDGATLSLISLKLDWPKTRRKRFARMVRDGQIKGVRVDRSCSPEKFKTGESTWTPSKWNRMPRQ